MIKKTTAVNIETLYLNTPSSIKGPQYVSISNALLNNNSILKPFSDGSCFFVKLLDTKETKMTLEFKSEMLDFYWDTAIQPQLATSAKNTPLQRYSHPSLEGDHTIIELAFMLASFEAFEKIMTCFPRIFNTTETFTFHRNEKEECEAKIDLLIDIITHQHNPKPFPLLLRPITPSICCTSKQKTLHQRLADLNQYLQNN